MSYSKPVEENDPNDGERIMAKREIPKEKVQQRDRLGSRYAARLRESGQLPVVIYGHKKDPIHASAVAEEIHDLLHRHTHLVEVVVDSTTEPCLVKDVQWDHLGSKIVHIDLARVDLNERVTVDVPLVLVGEAPGLKEAGAILEHPVTEIEVECLATEIPESIKADVSQLKVDDALTIGEIKLPEGVTTTLDADTIVAVISVVKEEVAEPVVAAEGGAEPEVIGKKAEEGEGAAGAPAAGGEKKPAGGGGKEGAKK
jgi:large subunit ribosomal protein L25